MRTIFHLDMDAFFISVERILNPKLELKPVIVGGDPHGRGVVAACSYEARKFGLHSGMPIRTAFKLCPRGIYLHGHYDEYSRYSHAAKIILSGYAPILEQASVDEFYIDFTGCEHLYGEYHALALKLQQEMINKLFLPCSIGIGSNKTIAKIASDYKKPNGITYVPPGKEKQFLAPLPIQVIPGVGKVMLKKLNEKGINIISDITNMPKDFFSTIYGKSGNDLWEKANGNGAEYLSPSREQKSISHETTFLEDVNSICNLEETLFGLSAKLAQSLKDMNWYASNIALKLRYLDFQTIIKSKSIHLTDDPIIIFNTSVGLLKISYTRRVSIRLIGIKLTKFIMAAEQQFLFDDIQIKRGKALDAINLIRLKYGYKSIQFGIVKAQNV